MNHKTQRRSSKRRRKTRKRQYRIRNWNKYNRALVQRGSLTLWLDEAAVTGWCQQLKSGNRGASLTYADSTILCALTLQSVYHLSLRATQGFVESVLHLLTAALPVPDYSTLCRRRQSLSVVLPRYQPHQNLHLVVDATGFKVLGEGEWKVRQHGWGKHRTWRKLHLGVDQATGELVAAVVTGRQVADKDVLADLLEQVEEDISQVSGDGGYDYRDCYAAIAKRQARAVIPPRCNAQVHPTDKRLRLRNENLRRIRELSRSPRLGRKRWKEESGYHRRSLVETAMFRHKRIFGDKVSAKIFASQANELFIRCRALNKMTSLGMPQSYAV